MDAHIALVFAIVALTSAPQTPPQNAINPPKTVVEVPSPVLRCEAQSWQHLVGRTISDLLTTKLPQGTRIYRTSDPIGPETRDQVRLHVEIGRNTRVRRVYCS
jgi:hypothetical protein